MNRQTKEREKWIATDLDANGQPRRYEIIHEEEDTASMVIDASPIQSPLPVQPVRSYSHVEGDYVSRARGFSIATWQLSVVTGAGLVIAAIVIGGIVGAALLAWFFAGFCAVWLASFALYTFVSSEGSEFLNTVFLWRFLRHEQIERHRRYGAPTPPRPRWKEISEKILLAFVICWLSLLLLAWLYVRNGGQ